jgi:DnaJ-class molecular chaperone
VRAMRNAASGWSPAISKAQPDAENAGEDLCPVCGGSGRYKDEECKNCGGSGRVWVPIGTP